MIKLQVIGNIGQDARVNEVNGRKSVNFSVAHNKKYKDAQGVEIESTFWVNCSYWKNEGQSTEILKYLISGTKVFVEGIPEAKMYKNKSGQMAVSINCTVTNLELLSAKKDNLSEPNHPATGQYHEPEPVQVPDGHIRPNQSFPEEQQNDDLPF